MSHEHSQLPWRHDPENPGLVLAYATDEDGRAVTVSDSVDPDDAEFIVHACNSHDDLFRQATKAAKQAEKMRAALGNIIERAQEIRDENSGDKCAMDASDIETMARAALESKEPQPVASHEVSQRPAAFSDNGSRGKFPAEGEPATPVRVGKNKTAGSPDSRKTHE